MEAAWLLVPAGLVLALFFGASLRARSRKSGPVAERVADVTFYPALFVCSVLLFGLMIARREG